MSQSEELIKYLSQKLTNLSDDMVNIQDKSQSWMISRALLEIVVIQTQALAAITEDLRLLRKAYDNHYEYNTHLNSNANDI